MFSFFAEFCNYQLFSQINVFDYKIFERELALLVALQGASSWKGGAWRGDIHWKNATSIGRKGRQCTTLRQKPRFGPYIIIL